MLNPHCKRKGLTVAQLESAGISIGQGIHGWITWTRIASSKLITNTSCACLDQDVNYRTSLVQQLDYHLSAISRTY